MNNISDLKFDDKNFNKHTEYGMGLLEKSLRENGAGRSILIDKDNNIIAGNGIIEAAGQAGFEKVKIVETTGDEIIAVKRMDIALDSQEGRRMALADNATASADLEWDKDLILEESSKWDLDIDTWGSIIGINWDEEEINGIIEDSSEGSIKDYDDDIDYNLKNLYRKRINPEIAKKIEDEIEKGNVREEIADILRTRALQCSIFNFDEIIKYYRSEDSTVQEKELLEKLYLVFITPKEALEKGILELNKVTGKIYDKTLMEKENEKS